MEHDKHKALVAIISKHKAKMGAAPMAPEAEPAMDGRELAANDIMDAVHSKDPHKLLEALGNFHEAHAAKLKEMAAEPSEEESE